jgi:hypothetical protein
MAVIDIDMEGVQEGGSYEPLEEGIYGASVMSIEQKRGRESGKPYLEFTFLLRDLNGRRLWRNYSLQPNALWALKTDLVKLGIEVPDGVFQFDTDEALNKDCKLKVIQKPHWQDATRMDNEVTELLPDDGEFSWNG